MDKVVYGKSQTSGAGPEQESWELEKEAVARANFAMLNSPPSLRSVAGLR
jgi:hypothetical protein